MIIGDNMIKINNNGFAISTMLYGLLIIAATIIFMLLASISFTKKTTNDFVNKVEKELIEFAEEKRRNLITCP